MSIKSNVFSLEGALEKRQPKRVEAICDSGGLGGWVVAPFGFVFPYFCL